MKRIRAFAAAVLPVGAFLVTALRADAATFDDAARLVVMIESEFDGQVHPGAGVVFSIAGDRAYVFTANHMVRDASARPAAHVDVYFRDFPTAPRRARVLEPFDASADVAVLEINGLQPADLSALTGNRPLLFDLIANSVTLPRGTPVYPIGYPGGTIAWGSPLLRPDLIDRHSSTEMLFQSGFVREGHSGGGLFTEDWRLVGMVLDVAQLPMVRALPVEAILSRLRDWNYPVGVLQGAGPATAAAVSTARAVAETGASRQARALTQELAEDGRIFVRTTSWGAVADSSLQWATLDVSRTQGLPPIPNADFSLEFGFQNLASTLWSIENSPTSGNETKPDRERPLAADSLASVTVRVVRSKGLMGLLGYNPVTDTERLTSRQLMAGQALRLRYTDKQLLEMNGKTDAREVRLFVKADPFQPEASSGVDQSPASPSLVARGSVVENSVDFDAGDASDHVSFNRGRGPASGSSPCRGVLLLRSGALTVTSSPAGPDDLATPSASLVAARIVAASGRPDAKAAFDVRLFDLRCEPGSLLRVQAPVHVKGDYSIYANNGTRDAKALALLLAKWLEAWEPMSHAPLSDDELDLVERGISLLQERTSTTVDDLYSAYDSYRLPIWDSKSLLESLFDRQRATIEGALARCCADATLLRLLLNLKRAEEGLPFNRTALERSRDRLRMLPPSIEARIATALGQASPRPR